MIFKLTKWSADQVKTHKVAVSIIMFFALIKFLFILSFSNTDWEPDSYMHFLELRTIYNSFPDFLNIGLGVWSKPLYSYILGIPVYIFNSGTLLIVEICNLLIFSLITFLVYKIVLGFTKNRLISLFSIILTLLSLTLFKSSTSALTESIFTLTLVLGFYAITRSRYYLASFFISLSVLGRIEGLFFIGIYFLWLIVKFKNWKILIKHLFILSIPGFAWNLLGYLNTGFPLYIFDNGYPTLPGAYGFGKIYSFLWQFLTREPLVSLFYALGIYYLIKKFRSLKYRHEVILLTLWTSLFFIAQSILWWKGLFGSAGLMRYFVSTIPFMIILGCLGLELISKRLRFAIVLLASSIQLLLSVTFITGLMPGAREYPVREGELIDAGNWVKENVTSVDFLGSDRPEVIYYAERDLSNSTIFYKGYLLNKRPGYYIWTKAWGESVSGISQSELEEIAIEVYAINDEVFIYRVQVE